MSLAAATVALAFAAASPSPAADAPTQASATEHVGGVNPQDERIDYFRVQLALDVGVPDGIALGLSVAPLSHVRLSLAALTNVIGFGIRGGLALVPFSSWTLHPVLSLELGRYFTGDLRQFVATAPQSFKYDFMDATGGLELSLSSVVVRLTGGVSRVWASQQLELMGYALNGAMPCAKLSVGMKLN